MEHGGTENTEPSTEKKNKDFKILNLISVLSG